VPTKRNAAKQLALECIGKSVVVYAGPKLFPAAYKWKISFNENAKQVAWCNQFSEFNHNEFIGWSKQPVDKPYTIVELRSTFEHERIQQRFALSDRLLSGCWPQPEVVEAQGTSALQHLLWASMMGDFVTVYTALLNGLDPSPVALVERFKHELAG
jgi:glucose/mannose-6-phosphate isomerase